MNLSTRQICTADRMPVFVEGTELADIWHVDSDGAYTVICWTVERVLYPRLGKADKTSWMDLPCLEDVDHAGGRAISSKRRAIVEEGRSWPGTGHIWGWTFIKDTIAAAVAWPGREVPQYRGILANRTSSLQLLIRTLQGPDAEAMSFVYEAGPCGYGVYREITETGLDCQVVAPGLIPRKPGDRVKTGRRDAVDLARLHRSGELTPVWMPGPD